MEMMRKPEDADQDQIDRHDVVEQSGHHQNQNSGDQCDERIKDFHVEIRVVPPSASASSRMQKRAPAEADAFHYINRA
jgi:hypothetical protein